MNVLAGKRILVVEDEFLIASLMVQFLAELGAVAVGPAYRLDEGMSLARTEALDAAVLDVDLNNERSLPIAEILRERSIPFILATGYGDRGAGSDQRILQKPYTLDSLAHSLRNLIATPPA